MQTILAYTPVPKIAQGHRTINTLERLIKEVGQWASETGNVELKNAMRDAYGLTTTCWTEFDESLTKLNQAVREIDRGKSDEAVESIRIAMKYMHRWQDRGGVIGNVSCVTEEELTYFMAAVISRITGGAVKTGREIAKVGIIRRSDS